MITWTYRNLTKEMNINWDNIYTSVSSVVPPCGILITREQLKEITIEQGMKTIFIDVVDNELIQMLINYPQEAIGWWKNIPVFVLD